jgi:hypothetical protein
VWRKSKKLTRQDSDSNTRESARPEKAQFRSALGNGLRSDQRLEALRLQTKDVGCKEAEADMEVIKSVGQAKERSNKQTKAEQRNGLSKSLKGLVQ